MGYVRDEKTGKFTWVEGAVDEDAPAREARRIVGAGTCGDEAPVTMRRAPSSHLPQAAVALLVLGAVGFAGWRTLGVAREPLVDLRRIHAKPAEFEGHVVRVRGNVGQVFTMGDSYAYYLLQGRDTIVVYTRGEKPLPNVDAEVCGLITIGYLDGSVRPALFQRSN